MKGIRIHSIVRELANENIDVINYTDDIALYIARALAPAKLKDIYLDKENKIAKIIADEDQVSLIIGKNGQNIKLAGRLTGYEIVVERKADKPRDIEEALERELARESEAKMQLQSGDSEEEKDDTEMIIAESDAMSNDDNTAEETSGNQ
jgi:transcription antitermination factor NusA-like protein